MAEEIRITTSVASVLREFLEDPNEPVYGFDLMRRADISSGSLYPILARLEKAGWIVGQLEDIDPVQEGRRPRRYYRLTGEGRVAARRELEALSTRLHPSWWFGARPAEGGA